ncbi:MAG: glycosyltransferase family 4 protein [Bacteroidales bacterium]|nr:glycosyltransferase family 4 protein [Bacteroidales bacterium]
MMYAIAAAVIIAAELIYFAIAKHFGIMDCPNERSSHTRPTLLGGGVVFFFSILCYSLFHHLAYPWFLLATAMLAVICFVDDLHPLPSLLRMAVQFAATLLVLFQFQVFDLAVWKIVMVMIIAVGTVNIYNFMDGVNGMLAAYSLVVLSTLAYVNINVSPFVDQDIIWFAIMAVVVFGFFNFRKKAYCFSGDVGSVVMGALVLFLLGLLIQTTPTGKVELSYLVFIGVYLADGGFTILKRMLRGENILLPHREHLYETLCNECKIPHLYVSLGYALAQLVINALFFVFPDHTLYAVCVAVVLLLCYSAFFYYIKHHSPQK